MSKKNEYTIMLFYSNYNQASLNTKIALNDFAHNYPRCFNQIKSKEVNYDEEKNICKKYGIIGIPALLVFLNEELVERYFGEITSNELEMIFQDNLV